MLGFALARVQWLSPPSRDDLSVQFNVQRGSIFSQLVLDLYIDGTGDRLLGVSYESYDESQPGEPQTDSFVAASPLTMQQFMAGAPVTLLFTPISAIFLESGWASTHGISDSHLPVSTIQCGAYSGGTDQTVNLTSGIIEVEVLTDAVLLLSQEGDLTGEGSNLAYSLKQFVPPYHYAIYRGSV